MKRNEPNMYSAGRHTCFGSCNCKKSENDLYPSVRWEGWSPKNKAKEEDVELFAPT